MFGFLSDRNSSSTSEAKSSSSEKNIQQPLQPQQPQSRPKATLVVVSNSQNSNGATMAKDSTLLSGSRLFESEDALPSGYKVLTVRGAGSVLELSPKLYSELSLIQIALPNGQQRVLRLSEPGWKENAENISAGMHLNSQIIKAGLPSPMILCEGTKELICRLNKVENISRPQDSTIAKVKVEDRSSEKLEERKVFDSPFFKVFSEILTRAVLYRSADIHVEVMYENFPRSNKNASRIRFRIDGDLVELEGLPSETRDPYYLRSLVGFIFNNLCSETPSQYDPNAFQKGILKERQVGGEVVRGRFQTFDVEGKQSTDGEKPFKFVMRLIYINGNIPTLSSLGFLSSQVRKFESYINRKSGLVCVSGKLGNGKTTTLRSLFNLLPEDYAKYNVEDPCEIPHPNSIPISISNGGGIIEKVMMALKRGDLNAVLLGEIRNKETMDFARNITFTGNPLFTTTHSESALGQLPYFLTPELGMSNAQLSNQAFIGMLFHQALVKKLCTCSEEIGWDQVVKTLTPARINAIEKKYGCDPAFLRVRNEHGCELCRKEAKGLKQRYGYNGLDVLAEMFVPTDDDLELIEQNKLIDLHRKWRSSRSAFDDEDCTGKTYWEVGLYKALRGRLDLLSIEQKSPSFVDAKVYKSER